MLLPQLPVFDERYYVIQTLTQGLCIFLSPENPPLRR